MPESLSTVTAPSTPSTPAVSTPATQTPSSTPAATDSGGSTPSESTPSTKFKFDLGDGGPATEIDFSEGDETPGESTELRIADLDAIKDSNPDLYKTLKGEMSQLARARKLGMKTPEDFKSINDRINHLSGGKGLDGLEQTLTQMAHELQGFRTGDVSTWAKEAPEEFGIAASKIADQWADADPRGYVGHVAKAAMHALLQKDSYGQSAIDAFNAAYAATTDPNTKKLLDRLAHTLDGINQSSQYVPDQTAIKERAVAQREAAVWNKTVDVETGPIIQRALNKAFRDATNHFGLEIDAEDRPSYIADMEKAWYDAAKKDTKFLQALDTAGKAKDIGEIKSLVTQNQQKFAAEALKAVYRTRLSKLKGNLRKEAGSKTEAGTGGSVTPGTIPWTGKTNPRTGSPDADFDFARMQAEGIDSLSGEFYVKGQKAKYKL
jgi:hypothetical protein